MKKNIFFAAALFLGLALTTASCSSDDDPIEDPVNSADLDYNSQNAASWHNYMKNVAALLKSDATSLYEAWATGYEGGDSFAEAFKGHTHSDYPTAKSCVQQIIEGCITIADEVGTAKIGDPYSLYVSGKTTEALYAVESWYSWHSRDDYTNNIYSIRNAYFGSLDGTVADASLSAAIKAANEELDNEVQAAIQAAADAIQAIPQPFRNNINSSEARTAMTVCSQLVDVLDNKLMSVAEALDADILEGIVENYVDEVVLPTYLALKNENGDLYNAIVTLTSSPSNSNFEKACQAWLDAREPWEKSEAFLFGPVDALGLDPNMDSWPLDQDAIVQILTSGNYDNLNWSDSDNDDAIEAAQSVRGFHTLEYLLFKNGNPRTVN